VGATPPKVSMSQRHVGDDSAVVSVLGGTAADMTSMEVAGHAEAPSFGTVSGEPSIPAYKARPRGPIKDFVARLVVALARLYAAAFRERWPLSVLWPAPWFFGFRLLVRYDHVVEALGRADVFRVPFGEEMARLNDGTAPGTRFMLGIDDPGEHDAQATCLMARLELDEVPAVASLAFKAAQERLPKPATAFEAIHGLITAVPIDLCNGYFGLSVRHQEDRANFAAASIELSGHLFGPPSGSRREGERILRARVFRSKDKQEDLAGAYVRHFVDEAIVAARQKTLAGKLRGLSHERARAILMGMIVGFVPTNTLAGGYILDVLLSKPDAMKAAVDAAQAGDDDRLWQCLLEALRLRPINLGPFRVCEGGYRFGTTSIPDGKRVWVMTGSAMRDSRRLAKPGDFDPRRPASSYLHFGFGMHWCIGARLAQAQLTQTFKALLVSGPPTRVSRLAYRGTFPDQLKIKFKIKE
jgi:cytochrome P450